MKLILAVNKDWAIGKDNQLLYHFPQDLKRFKELTRGAAMIMGRKTWDSLPGKLPGRKHVVLCTAKVSPIKDQIPDHIVFDPFTLDFQTQYSKAWVIGGVQVARLLSDHISKVELTVIKDEGKEADTHATFLKELLQGFRLVKTESITDTDRLSGNEYGLIFQTWIRR